MKYILTFWIYYLPIPLFFLLGWGWYSRTQSLRFTLFTLLLPLLYGYLVPGIGTNVLKKWRFNGKFLLGAFFWHHGFKYSSNINLLFFLIFTDAGPGVDLSLAKIVSLSLSMAFAEGFTIWIHDTHLIKHGILELLKNPLAAQGKSAEEIAFSYAPASFFAIGGSFALAALTFFKIDAGGGVPSMSLFGGYLLLGLFFMTTVSMLAFGAIEMSWKKVEDG